MSQLTDIQTLTGRLDKDALFVELIVQAEEEFLDYTGRITIPTAAEKLIDKMVVENFNHIGAEGISSQGYSNISESFVDGYSANIIKQLQRYRKAKFI